MNKERLTKFIGNNTICVVEAMEQIDYNCGGILYIIDENQKLQGCITDGDIRRWLIKTGDLKAPIKQAMNGLPIFLFEDELNKAKDTMKQKKITSIPVIDKERRIVDLILLSEIVGYQTERKKSNLSKIPTIIMAGGKGMRLYPFTKILPKPLIPIGETPIVERIMNCYSEYGIKDFYMTVNYKKNMIKSYFSENRTDFNIEYIEEDKPLGTAGSIKLIKDTFDKPMFVANCDALIYTDYSKLYDYHITSGNDITIVAALKNITVPYGVLYPGDNGEVISMEEKPKLSYFINTGMYVINPEMIEVIPSDKMYHMTDLIDEVMKNKGKVRMYPISEDSFLDMGEFDEMKRMEEKLNIASGVL